MLSGMVIASKRHVAAQLRQPTIRSIFRPAPISETMTMNSAIRSVRTGMSSGSGRTGIGARLHSAAPMVRQIMGSVRGGCVRSTSGITRRAR